MKMMNKLREDLYNVMEKLDNISGVDYQTFELALVLYLRSDIYTLDDITDLQLKKISKLVNDSDSLMSDDLREKVDNILNGDEE